MTPTVIEIDGNEVHTSVHWLVGGVAAGAILALDEPLSFWGGFDSHTGAITDRHHPQCGAVLTGRIVVMQAGRGSSSASSVIAEAIRIGTAPAAIVLHEPDEIVTLGAIVADELYGIAMPVLVVDDEMFDVMTHARFASIEGSITSYT